MQLERCSVAYEQENGIGQEFALYYLAYATYLELRGSFAMAETVFQEGLSRSAPHYLSFPCMAVQVLLHEPRRYISSCRFAHPIDRLRTKYDDFRHRMVMLVYFQVVATSMSCYMK